MNIEEMICAADAYMCHDNVDAARSLYAELCRMDHLTAEQRGMALFGMGTCFFLDASYDAATVRLRESLEMLSAANSLQGPLATRTMVLLSRSLIAQGDLASGMDIGRTGLKRLIELYGVEAEQTATASFFLASGAYRSGLLAEAEDLLQQALAAWESLYGHASLQVATCLDALARLHEDCGEYAVCQDFLRQSLEIKQSLFGETEATAMSLGQLGIIAMKQKNWEEAAAMLGTALQSLTALAGDAVKPQLESFRAALELCKQNGKC